MAIEQTFNSNGVLKEFTITNFDFLRSTDLNIYIDPTGGTAKTQVTENTGSVAGQYTVDKASKKITFISSNINGTLQTNDGSSNAGAPLAGVVTVERITGINNPINTFQAGSAITAEQLNDSLNQLRFNIEEFGTVTASTTGEALTDGDKGDIVVGSDGSSFTVDTGAVNADKLATNAVETAKIKDDNVTYPKLQDIVTANRVLGRASAGEVQEVQVNRQMIADHAVNVEHYEPGSVDYYALKDTAVHQNKIHDESVNEAKMEISNAGTNGQYLQKSSNTGGLTWASGVIEQFTLVCMPPTAGTTDNTATVGSGTYTPELITNGASQLMTTVFTDLQCSRMTYTAPAGAKFVVYQFDYMTASADDMSIIFHTKLFLGDGASPSSWGEVTKARYTSYVGGHSGAGGGIGHRCIWSFPIGGTPNESTGRVASWDTPKTIKMQVREWASNFEGKLHETQFFDGNNPDGDPSGINTHYPVISITALG